MVAKATSNKKLILIVIALFFALTTLIYLYLQNKSAPATSNQTNHAGEKNTTSTPALPESEENTDIFAALIDDELLTQPIPEDQALIKDELGQLNDIQQQLNEQKELLEQQHQDADKLLELKEQQLAELERELKANH